MFKFVAALFLALVGAAAGRLSAPDELAATPQELDIKNFPKQLQKNSQFQKMYKKFERLSKADGARRLTGDDDDDDDSSCTTELAAYASCLLSNTDCITDDDDDGDDVLPNDDDWQNSCSTAFSTYYATLCTVLDDSCSECEDTLTDYYECLVDYYVETVHGLTCTDDDVSTFSYNTTCSDDSSAATTGLPLFAGTVFAAVTMLFAGKAF